ncbi:MAG: DUF4093 domain-containing protein [Clostridia bacterium]|nr:DUF4093 domain-containing protein [Clostridia bacterium]
MERERIKLPMPVIVEGRYDKSKLAEILDCQIITTDGFGIFAKKEKLALIRRLSMNGVIVMTDSDGAGGVIRSYIKSALPPDKLYNLYIPKIEGKEKRKTAPSKEGTLGVEGMKTDLLYSIFCDFVAKNNISGDGKKAGGITKADFYEVGMTGFPDSSAKRDEMAEKYGLPDGMTPNSLLGALNMLCSKDEFYNTANELWND